jgi:hypothetical protein
MKMHVLWRCNTKQLESYSGTARFDFRSMGLSSYLMFVLVYTKIVSFQFLYNLTLSFSKELGAVSLYNIFPTFLFKEGP